MQAVISVSNLSKTYASGFQALKNINLERPPRRDLRAARPERRREDDADQHHLRHRQSYGGTILVDGHDIVADYRAPLDDRPRAAGADHRRLRVGVGDRFLQPRTVRQAANPAHIEKVLKDLSLWDKKDSKIMTLSGGMKRRLLIAKALSHEPQILFLDEPTAGVDVELRRDMWELVRSLREGGVTIILTTHYIDEAEEMADRVGVINKGEIILVEDKAELMRKLGKKQLTLQLQNPLARIPRGSRAITSSCPATETN